MYDQVSILRKIASERDAAPNTRKNMRVIAVSSGKGGVGKTSLVVNLALALAEYKYQVIIFDGDLGLANVDIAFGIVPRYSIRNLLSGEKKIEEILYPVDRGIKVLPGASGVMELANLDRGQLKNVLINMGRLERMADILLIDTGAGLGHTVLNFISASDDVLVVMTPEPPSMTDAYGLLKAIKNQAGRARVKIVVNRVRNEAEARQAFERVKHAADKFLAIPLELLGWVYDDPMVGRSVMAQKPVGLSNPQSHAYQCIRWMAGNIAGIYTRTPIPSNGIKGFISSLLRNI